MVLQFVLEAMSGTETPFNMSSTSASKSEQTRNLKSDAKVDLDKKRYRSQMAPHVDATIVQESIIARLWSHLNRKHFPGRRRDPSLTAFLLMLSNLAFNVDRSFKFEQTHVARTIKTRFSI